MFLIVSLAIIILSRFGPSVASLSITRELSSGQSDHKPGNIPMRQPRGNSTG